MDSVTDTDNVTEWLRTQDEWVHYQGIVCYQFQSDMDRYSQLIRELAPPFIVEIGRAEGGTALFLADELTKVRADGVVVSIDVIPPRFGHPRIRHLTGDSLNENVWSNVLAVTDQQRGLVLLDGNHSSTQVGRELAIYARVADYLIVEDTIIRDLPGSHDGPHVALDAWLPDHPEFVADPDPIPTQHPGGWLRRTI